MTESRYRLGFLGAWGLFIVGTILAAAVATAEWQNLRDGSRLRKLTLIDRMIAERLGPRLDVLRETAQEREGRVEELHSAVRETEMKLDDSSDTDQIIVVSTAENRLYVRRAGKTIFQAVCSTGKGGTTLTDASGRTMVFNTPTGKFRVVKKEENPLWVPPDWHFVEEARKKGKRIVRLSPGERIDARTGEPTGGDEGVHSWGAPRASGGRVLTLKGNTVVEVGPDGERELPPGEVIEAGGAIVVPPYGTPQRKFDKVLGKYRLNLGGGYGIHGTMYPDQLGRSATHGCVRLGDADIETVFGMAQIGDQVLIY